MIRMRGAILAALLISLAYPLSSAEPAAEVAQAIALYRQKQNTEARAAFEAILLVDDKNAEASHFLGLIALREQRDDDAVRLHEKATALDPQNSTYFIALGDAYGRKAAKASLFSKLEWAQKCRAALEKAVALDPASYAAQSALIEYYRRAPAMAGGGLNKAYAQARLHRESDKIGGTLLLADLYHREAKNTEVFAVLEDALHTHPDHYALLLNLGRAAADSGEQLERGAKSLERCLNLEPVPHAAGHATAWFYLGRIRAREGNVPAARRAFESALTLRPDYRDALDALERL